MHPVYTNGRDTCIDGDFFIGLGADRDSIRYTLPEHLNKGQHELGFRIGDEYYSSRWNDQNNRISITCEGLSYDQYELADQRLYALSKKITKDMFGDLVVRKIVAWPEGMKPELMILLYEK